MPELESRQIRRYGWRPDLPDHRDLLFSPEVEEAALPPKVDLRPKFAFPPYDQGQLGSCTANAVAGIAQFCELGEGEADPTPSRLFIYYNERVADGSPVDEDTGSEVRTGLKVLHRLGFCPETDWPYDIAKFAEKPPAKCYSEAKADLATAYQRVSQTAHAIRAALAGGHPVAFGFTVYESFESDAVAKTGIVPMPGKREKVLGGHAVVLVGYDTATGRYVVRNSWGTTWGESGYFEMPFAYVENPNLASDFWVVTAI